MGKVTDSQNRIKSRINKIYAVNGLGDTLVLVPADFGCERRPFASLFNAGVTHIFSEQNFSVGSGLRGYIQLNP